MNSKMEKLQVGMLSFEHMHAFSYASVLKQLPDAQLVAAWDDDPQRIEQCGKQFEIPRCTTSLDEILSLPLDAVVICSRNTTHLELAHRAAEAGKHILCEKPIATTVEDGQAMIDICAKAGVKLMVAFPCRYVPQMARAKEIVQQGKLGEIFAVKTTNHGSMPGGWFTRPELSGGGAVLDHTVHVIDLLRWMTGLEVSRVYAEMDTRLHDLPCEDVGLLTFTLGEKIFGTLDTSWSRPSSYSIWGDVTLRFVGSQGILEVDGFPQALHIYDNAAEKQHEALSGGDNADAELIKDFLAAIREDRSPSVSGEDGLRALEVALAAYRSAEKCESVPVR